MNTKLKLVPLLISFFVSGKSVMAENYTSTIFTSNGPVSLSEEFLEDKTIIKTFENEEKILYQTKTNAIVNGFVFEVLVGHTSQLGEYTLIGDVLEVKDRNGKLLWTEKLDQPLCPPELAAEFVRANWDSLTIGGDPLECVIPIIKAEKVAPVKWVRLNDTNNGERVVELRPNSFGMRFFLSNTRFTFNNNGDVWLTQDGQFESTRDPDKRAQYMKGSLSFTENRAVQVWDKSHFGIDISD